MALSPPIKKRIICHKICKGSCGIVTNHLQEPHRLLLHLQSWVLKRRCQRWLYIQKNEEKNIHKRGGQTGRHGLTSCNGISIVTLSVGFRCIGVLVWSRMCGVVWGVWRMGWKSRAAQQQCCQKLFEDMEFRRKFCRFLCAGRK